jgi:hypothetical protein
VYEREHTQYLAQVGLVAALVLGPGSTEEAELASVWPNELGSWCTSATCVVAVCDSTGVKVE